MSAEKNHSSQTNKNSQLKKQAAKKDSYKKTISANEDQNKQKFNKKSINKNKNINKKIKKPEKSDFMKSLLKSKLVWVIVAIIILFLLCLAAYCTGYKNGYADKETEMRKQIQLIEEENDKESERRLKDLEDEYKKKLEEKSTYSYRAQKKAVWDLKSVGLKSKILDVSLLYQFPELPAGCEPIALTNLLNYFGFNLGLFDIVEKYIEYDNSDWVNYYVGSPYDEAVGGACMCPAIENACNNVFDAHQSNYECFDITGKDFEDLFAYIERGNPVQIWSSICMDDLGELNDTNGNYSLYWNTHSVLLTGFDRENDLVYIADSISGNVSYSISQVKEIYKIQNKQAFVVVSNTELNSWIKGIDASYEGSVSKTNLDKED